MTKLTMLIAIAYMLISLQTFGQETIIHQPDEQGFIEVTGTAEKEVIPDEIYIEIIITEKYVDKNKVTIDEQEEKLKASLKSIGIELSNLYLTDANADFVKVRWQKKDLLTKKDYTLKVSTATEVGQVFLELEKLEILDASILKVNHSKIDSLKKEVKIEAIKAAKEKAEYLLAAIGEKIEKPLFIRENEIIPYQTMPNINLRKSYSYETECYVDGVKVKSENHDEIQFQKIKIQSSVYIKFLIE